MANQFTKAKGGELVGCLAFCLRADGPRRLLGWFNLSNTDKEALLKMLKSLFGNEIDIDLAGLRKMIETFMDLTDPGTILDRDRVSWEAVANGKSKIQQLELNVTGRRIWYESLKEEGDTEWKEDDKPPPMDEQYYLSKLRKVGRLTLDHLKVLEARWKKGERMLELYKSFTKIANTTGPGQTILNLQLKETTVGKVVETIKKGNKEANDWATEISAYFNVPITGEFQEAMKFFFAGSGYEIESKIDWGKLRKRLEDEDITALKIVSEEIKPASEMAEVDTTLKILGETMLRINNLGEEPVETEKERKDNRRRKDIRDGFKEKYERWYQTIVAAYIAGGEAAELKATKIQLIKYGEIVKSLAGTWADIRNHDSDFVEVRKLKYHADGEEKVVDAEDGLIEMSERIREAEEKQKEERKAKEDLQKQDVKRSEAMMKKENMVTYEGKASFLEWAGTITKLLEQLPESTADVIVCSFVKTTINHKETFNLIQNCKTTEEIMKIMGELHATDKSVVIEAFAPVKQLKKPTTYSIAFHNGQVILRTADTLISIGIEEAIELNELDLCVDKAIHDARYQAWLEYSHTELKKLAAADAEGHPIEKTKLEEKGKYDITHSIQSFNKGRSLARNFHLLCKWIKEDMSLVQDAKDREERTQNRGHSTQRGGGNLTGSYFVQQSPGTYSAFGGNRGNRQAPGGYRKQYGTNGGVPQGTRLAGISQGRPNKHPDCQIALERWRSLKGVGMEAKPMTKDCPLKCSHAIPFGNAGWCTTFRKYEPSMKLDVVKKNGLCRRCLSNWGPPHSPKDCRAPACNKCKGDHNMLICPAPSGSIQIHATGFVDIYKNKGVFDDLDPQIMMLTLEKGEERVIQANNEEIGQFYIGETSAEEYTEDDMIFEDPEEPVNNFCINFIEDTLQIDTIGIHSQSQETGMDNGEIEETMPEEERICSKDTMGELKSDDTKPTEQRVSEGHTITEPADRLGTAADNESSVESGCKDTEGTPNGKVNIISQADQNSETLCSEKPAQETGPEELAGGNPKHESHTQSDPGEVKKEKQVKKLTWLEKMWAKVPEEGTKDWIKSVYTQETDWGDQSEMMWKQILQEGNIEPIERPLEEDKREEIIESGRSTRHLMRKEHNVSETNAFYTEFKIKEQRYPSYIENQDYHLLNKKTAKDEIEKELYARMVKAAVKINKIFPSVRGMTDAVCVVGKSKQPNAEMLIDDKGTWVTCLFDNGAEAGTHTQTLDEAVELERLEERTMTLNTVNGAVRKIFEIKKIKLATERKNPDRNIVHALSSAQVNQIGIQKGHMKAYVNIVSFLLQMTPKLKKHFMKQCSDDQKEIQLILGQKGGSMLMHEVIPEQLGLRQHWLLPNLRIFKNPLTQNLILAGELGIEGRLVDEDYPTLYPTKQEFERLKEKLANKEDISDELGENLMAKQFVPNEYNNSAYYYQEVESSARSANVRTVNDPYAEVTLSSEEETQGAMREARIADSLQGIWEETSNNYMIDLTDGEETRVRESLVAEHEDMNVMFNNQDCENLKKFMESEADFSFEAKCERCRKRDCEDCNMLKNRYSAEDSKVFRELWNNVTLVEEAGKTRVQVKYLYRHDPHETFKPENSNLEEAKRRTDSLIRKLKKEGNMDSFKEQIASKIELGTLKEVPEDEWGVLLKGTHNFCYLSMVSNENSQSTGSRLINDTLTSNREGASFSLENKVPSSNIGDSYSSLINFRLYRHGYSSDISKCYLRVKVDELTSRLRLCYWYRDPENMQDPVIYIRTTMDFGDSIAALVIRIIQLKFLMAATRMDLVKEVLLKGAYADNYNSSFRTIEEYTCVRDEMNRIHDSIGLPLKGTYTDVGTDPGILQKLAKENGESPTYTFLGLTWDLKHNTLLPNSYFNLEKKKKGVQGAKKLMDMTTTDFAEPSFTWGLTRRVISRITAQAYSRLGAMLAPVIMNLKICVSRACEIMGPSELDIPIATKDAKFARTVARVCSNLPELRNLKPFDKAIIPEGGVMTAIGSLGDGGAPGLGGNVYIGSERMINGAKEINCNLLAMKSKVSKRTIPAHEMMSKPHQANMVKEVAKSIEFRVEVREAKILVIMGGDSVCTACLFNPEIEIRNVLIKGAINTTKQRMKEILEILPEATIHLTWIAGDKNTADAATKLHSNPVRVLNSDTYRHGPKELLMIDGEEHISYYKMDARSEVFTPLPEKLIQTAKGAEDKMKNMDPTRTMSNNPIEEQENSMCITCTEEEMCGIYATTRAMARRQSEPKTEEHKAPKKEEETKGKEYQEKREDDKFKLQDKRKILEILRENETYKAMRKRAKKNLFDPHRDYSLGNIGFAKEGCEWATSMSLRTNRMLAIGRYVVLFTQLAKGESITLEEARIEMWRKMILSSQEEKEGEQLKMFTYQTVQGVKCVELRIAEDNARDIWGTKVLPVISGDSLLGTKLIREAHERMTEGFGTIHEGITSTLAALQTGEKGVFIPYAKKHISGYMMSCVICNAWKSWTYTAKLNDKYTKTTINATPFADVSIDMLGSVEAKTFPGSRRTYKIFPLIIKCIETAAVWAVAMEGATTQDVVKALLRLEVRYGEIRGISRDAGSNLLQGNINPLLASGKNESAQKRLFGLIKEYTCPTDAQFRNYSERSTGLFKRAIKDLLEVKRDKHLPALTKSSWDLILELAADVCNKLPMGKLNDDYVCPGDLIRCGRNEIVVGETCSKLGQLDRMMKGLSQYYAVINHARNEMLRANLISFVKGNIKEGTGKRTIVAEVGDLVLIKTSDFTKRGIYGVITEIHGEGSATVRTKDGDMKRAIGQLCPLAGNCLSR